ncbi:glycoside hydrolase family 43 protein [Herbidospora sp. RD11066]
MSANPIIPGFHPDPSICRVGDDYYVVTSSFEWFPGVPIFHSRDLVHWRQLGHVCHSLDLDGVRPSGGIYAPTLRHHDGVFYMVTTLMDEPGNFLVTSTSPEGPWSEPVWFPEARGFDPSLFFDDDGRCWMHGSREREDKTYPGDTEIWLRELDLASLKLVGEEYVIWTPHLRGGIWTEGPHIYRAHGWYYLVTSEGGTAEDHAVMVARSRMVTGPYEGNSRNPVLTHRHLGLRHPITSTGHPDLVETPSGEWWSVLLATRPYGGTDSTPLEMSAVRREHGYNLGRETFLTRVTWEDEWPVFDQVTPAFTGPSLPVHRWPAGPSCDHFDRLAPEWQFLRTPRETFWSVGDGLTLKVRPPALTERGNPSLVARPQTDIDFAAHTELTFSPGRGEHAGLALIQNDDFHIRLSLRPDGLELVHRAEGIDTLIAWADASGGRVWLGFEAWGQSYQARYALSPGDWLPLGPPVDGRILSSTVAGGFIGTMIALYATSEGRTSSNSAAFAWFDYRAL